MFKDTANTEINTNRNTLSLQDALPIFADGGRTRIAVAVGRSDARRRVNDAERDARNPARPGDAARGRHGLSRCAGCATAAGVATVCGSAQAAANAGAGRRRRDSAGRCAAARSAEDTSALQSLMRISYAVFCWKQTTTLNA